MSKKPELKSNTKPSNKDKEIVDFVKDEFLRYERFHNERFEKQRKIYDRWKNKPIERSESWQNRVNVPVTFQGEQTITPRLFTALFPNEAPVDVMTEGDAPKAQGVRLKGILQHYFKTTKMQNVSYSVLTQNTLFGTGYAEAGNWFQKNGWTIENNGERAYGLIEARPDFRFVDFFEMFPHPSKINIGDGLPLIRRRYIDSEVMKKMADDGKFLNLDKALVSKNSNLRHKDYQYKAGEDYELIEMWHPYDETFIEDDGRETLKRGVPYWTAIINREVLVRHQPNPYNHQKEPFVKINMFTDVVPCWFGYGLGEAGLPTQDRLNKIVNQRLDNVDLVMNKQGFYNANDTSINIKKLQVSKPGLWHGVSDTVSSIRWMDTPDVTQSAYNEEKLAKDDFREATGATQQLMPTGEGQHRTAMGINLLTEAAGMRFRPILRKMESDLVQETAMFFYSNLKQFMTEEQWVQVIGKDGTINQIKVTPQDVQAKVFFIPTGISETMNKEIQVGQLLRFKEVTANDPTVNRKEINKRIAELFGFKEFEELFTPTTPISKDGLPTDMQTMIQQRVAEGASPDQIKAEMLGPRPNPEPIQQGVTQ